MNSVQGYPSAHAASPPALCWRHSLLGPTGPLACLMASFAAPSKVIIEKSCGGEFNGTEIEIWAGFGPVGDTEKENTFGLIMNNF